MMILFFACVVLALAMIPPTIWENYENGRASSENMSIVFVFVGAVFAGEAPIFLRHLSTDTITVVSVVLITVIWFLALFFLGEQAWKMGVKRRSVR